MSKYISRDDKNNSKSTLLDFENYIVDVFYNFNSSVDFKNRKLTVQTNSDVNHSKIGQELYNEILTTLKNELYEEGVYKESYKLYCDLKLKFDTDEIAKTYLEIFRENVSVKSDRNIIRTLLNLISEININSSILWSIAQLALNLPDVVSIDLAISCFEKWGRKENIDALKTFKYSEKWITDYVSDVINYLESL